MISGGLAERIARSIAPEIDMSIKRINSPLLDSYNFNHGLNPPLICLPYRKQRAVMKSLVLLAIRMIFGK